MPKADNHMPKQLKILIHPDPELRKTSRDVEAAKISEPEFKEFLADMKETMLKKDGAGLAAPQIGKNMRASINKKKYKQKKYPGRRHPS